MKSLYRNDFINNIYAFEESDYVHYLKSFRYHFMVEDTMWSQRLNVIPISHCDVTNNVVFISSSRRHHLRHVAFCTVDDVIMLVVGNASSDIFLGSDNEGIGPK